MPIQPSASGNIHRLIDDDDYDEDGSPPAAANEIEIGSQLEVSAEVVLPSRQIMKGENKMDSDRSPQLPTLLSSMPPIADSISPSVPIIVSSQSDSIKIPSQPVTASSETLDISVPVPASSKASVTLPSHPKKIIVFHHSHKESAAAKQKRDMEEEEREKMQVLVSNFTEDQLDRYEMFRRAAFPKASIKRLMQTITGNTVTQNAVIAMAGIAKVFIGELVEEGLDVMERGHETGPVQPKHIREAVRKIRMRHGIPNSKARRYCPFSL